MKRAENKNVNEIMLNENSSNLTSSSEIVFTREYVKYGAKTNEYNLIDSNLSYSKMAKDEIKFPVSTPYLSSKQVVNGSSKK